MGYIYKLILNKNLDSFSKGEIYIGKHNEAKANYFGSGKLVRTIVTKYGKEVFDREIICQDIHDEELLNYLEVYYVRYYNCNRSLHNSGLNLTEGGEGIHGYVRTDDWKSKVSEKLKENYKSGSRRPPRERTVYQYSLDTGELINEFNNCLIAANSVGNSKLQCYITRCAKGQGLSCGGFAWNYEKLDNYKPKKIDKQNG